MNAADGTPIVERPEAAIKSAARFARELARKSKHCEAAADCVHCNLYFLAARAENMISDISRAEEREETLRNDLASQRNCTAQLESNIQFLNERLAAATGACRLHSAGDNTPICSTHMEQVPLNSGQCPIGGAVLLAPAEQRERVMREALERIRFICTAEGHAPCRCGGMASGEVCANTCMCEWPDDINAIIESALATPAPEQPAADLIVVQQERIATLERVLAENKRVLEIAMGTVARLSAPVSDAEINVFCWGFTDVVKARFDLIIAARATPPAPQDTENAVSEAQ